MARTGNAWPMAVVVGLGTLACRPDDGAVGPTGSTGATATSDTAAPADTVADSTGGTPMEPVPGPWDRGWPVPAEPQSEGDPAAGYHDLLHTGYLSCGVPQVIWPLVRPWLGGYVMDETIPGREGDNATMAYDWTVHTAPSGVRLVSQNCLQCHAGRFNGELIIGLGNADRDFTSSTSELLGGLPIAEFGIQGTVLAELTKFIERTRGIGDNAAMRTIGTNPAEMVAISLVAHRDVNTLAWSEEPWFDIPEVPVPSDVPPWWRSAKKNALFYNAMARGDHRGTMILATALCTDTVDEAMEIASHFDDIHAYVRSLQAPKYPFAIDEALAAAGEPIFNADCAPCHGTYAEQDADEWFPNLLLPLDVVGTDPVVAEGGTLWAPELVQWYSASYYGSITRMEVDDPFTGYLAPPLDGVWATGPFLHNGSVPNLALVLDSTRRPTYWRRIDFDSTHFDEISLGWPYLALDYGHEGASAAESVRIYDTTQFGHGAGGHTFGDHLSPDERTAVLEYLKTL